MKKQKFPKEPSVFAPADLPETAEAMVNKYGTYEIQSTAETENQYPAIAQGFNKKIIETNCDNPRKNPPDETKQQGEI
ncbi:MAG: hypothetical protein E7560_00250 [Ruminococcaceae bacterium]|nr:hypothetical protein [Oscillospiraceae bacterium]